MYKPQQSHKYAQEKGARLWKKWSVSPKHKLKKRSWSFSKLIFIYMTTCQDSPGMLIVAAMMQLTNTVSASAEADNFIIIIIILIRWINQLHFQSGKMLTRSKQYQSKHEAFPAPPDSHSYSMCVWVGGWVGVVGGLRQTNYQMVQK